MKVTGPRVRRTVVGLTAALALAAGGTAAVAAATSSHVSSRPAAHTTALHQAGLAAKARASLLRYLSKSKGWNFPTPGGGPHGVTPSIGNVSASSSSAAQVSSYNWSGYADYSATADTFSAVSGSWREPATTCSAEQRLAAFWVGIDGYDNETVEQDGTLAYCFEGRPSYYTWYELYPAGSFAVGQSVRPGDLITASVTRSGTSYTLAVTDANHRSDSFSTTQPCATCENDSVEWIAERPSFSIGMAPLTYFTDWTVTNASRTSATEGSIAAGPNATQLTMGDATGAYALARVSPLSDRGTSFTARWLNSY